MGATPLSTPLGFIAQVPNLDVQADLAHIAAPTLVVTTDGSGLGGVEGTHDWQKRINRSELMVLPGDSYHVAATHAELCAATTFEFIARRAVVLA